MIRHITFARVAALTTLSLISTAHATTGAAPSPTRLVDALRQVSIPFVKNQGLMNPEVAYYAKTFAGTVFVGKSGDLVYSLPQGKQAWAFRERFKTDQLLSPQAKDQGSTRIHIFRGGQAKNSPSEIASSHELSLGQLSTGVTVALKANGDNVEKLFYIAPGATVDAIHVDLIDSHSIVAAIWNVAD